MKNQKNITDRKKLKSFFKKGNLPSESDFEKLIDSTFNKADDKLDITEEGLMIYPSEDGKAKLLSFFEDKDDVDASWAMHITKKDDGGICIKKIEQENSDNHGEEEDIEPPAFFIQKKSSNVGLGTDSPNQKLDVKGVVAAEGRVGNFKEGTLDADGQWRNIFDKKDLKGCNAYEIMAYVEGENGEGKYSLMHAIAISTLGNSKPKITKTCAHYGKSWNKLAIRWESRPSKLVPPIAGEKQKIFDLAAWWQKLKSIWEPRDNFRYNLQLRTKRHYGKGIKIHYKVSVLWDSNFIKTTQ